MNKRYFTKGFTLIEVMVSIAILGMIMTLVWSTSSQNMKGKKRAEARENIYHEGTVALRKISDDLTMAFLAKKVKPSSQASQGATPLPESATQTETINTFFIGEDSGDRDNLKFTSLSHLRLFKNARESDECKILYEIEASKDEQGTYTLLRREEPWIDTTIDVKSDPLVLASGIDSFNVEYYDYKRAEWRKEWSSEKQDEKDRLPDAVRITIGFEDPNNENEKIELSTAAFLPMAKSPLEY